MTEWVENVLGYGQGGFILVPVGTNNADREGTTVIMQRYRQGRDNCDNAEIQTGKGQL